MWHQAKVDNESDVEQKIIYPLMTEAYPFGLGIEDIYIKTKANIKRIQIGKGAESKLYYPDYVILIDGYPAVIIEAKAPKVDLTEAYREARLYANEINSAVQNNLNTCKYVLAINGQEIWYGYWDQSSPIKKIRIEDCSSISQELNDLQEFISIDKIKSELRQELKSNVSRFSTRAKKLLGGFGIQGEELDLNTFGATVTSAISRVFNPISKEDRNHVAQKAYVNSRRKQRYIEPIDKLIRAAKPISISGATQIENTENPKEIIDKLLHIKSLDRQVMLLIGSVGSGKSTFIDHLLSNALDKSLLETITPVRIDMNTSPLSVGEIYSWLRNKIIDGCKNSLPDIDFDTRETTEKVYSAEVNKAKKGDLSYFEEGSKEWLSGLRDEIVKFKSNEILSVNAYVRFCCADRGKTLVVVLDNCDKKETKEQLLMFQVAQWLQDNLRCLVILPLRDETYDNYRNEPPLDTALKDLVFRIEPPLLQQVLVSRVKLALQELKGGSNDTLFYALPNGFRVEYPKSERAYYLTAILNSMFEHNNFVRNIIVGLSGKNIRRALEIFIDLCNSAHLDASEILKIRQSEGKHKIAFHKIVTILLRSNKRYYDSDSSYIKNLFDRGDLEPSINTFTRYLILVWLKQNLNSNHGIVKGYHPIRNMMSALNGMGFSEKKVFQEVLYLLEGDCIVTEDFKKNNISMDTLLKISPSGEIHLDLASNITYLSAISEECLMEVQIAERVKKRITHIDSQMSSNTCLQNAFDLHESLAAIKKLDLPPFENYILGDSKLSIDLTDIEFKLKSERSLATVDPWFLADKKYTRGSFHNAVVQNKLNYGCFVGFDDGTSSRIKNENITIDNFGIGDTVKVEIMWINTTQKKIGAKILELVEEETGDIIGLWDASN